MDWIHDQDCAACGSDWGIEGQHILGETYAEKVGFAKTNLGHWAVLALCHGCHQLIDDDLKLFHQQWGLQVDLWQTCTNIPYLEQTGYEISPAIAQKIREKQK